MTKKKKETGQYKIPFDSKTGSLLHYAYPATYTYMQDQYTWKDNHKFFDTLDFDRYARGRSAAYIWFKSKTTGKQYCMFLKEFETAIKSMVFGELEGEFTFIKRGENYGLVYLGKVSNVGFPLTSPPGSDSVGQKRTCNQHSDCIEADQKAEANGNEAFHCTIEDCEDCFGC